MGAASSAPDVNAMTPELRDAISSALGGKNLNQAALTRQARADSLPVPIRLTEGQATQDVTVLSREQNLRGKHKELADRFDQQNKALAQNLQTIRDQVGPDVFTTNAVEHGDTLINAYKAKAQAAEAEIAAKYQALRDANGGQFPIDAKALLDDASKQLHKALLFDEAPPSIMKTLERLSRDGMTFENFESLRTNLARIQRSHTDNGNVRAAAGIIRSAMERLPLSENAAHLKGLADDARQSARKHFGDLDADPAYKAAVEDSVPADRFVQRFVVGGNRDALQKLVANIGTDPTTKQTLAVAVLDHLRDQARLNANWEGNFAAASYGKALQGLTPKLRYLVDPRTADTLDSLGQVARDTTFQARGSFVNNSNTLVGALAEGAGPVVENAANYAASGLPIGTVGRRFLEGRVPRKDVQRYISPGAGIDR